MTIHWGKIVDDPAEVAAAAHAGFTHVQLSVDIVMAMSEAHFAGFRDELGQQKINAEVCTSPLPPEVYVTEMGFNLYAWTEYLKKAMKRIADLGCKKLAWNDGRTRVLPWEGDITGAKEQVLQFLYMLCEVSDTFGITVMVEPLGPRRTNFLNSLPEVEDILARLGKQNLRSMISFRELPEIGLKIEDIDNFTHLIDHVQLENPLQASGKRIPPLPGDGQLYAPFLNALRRMGYAGTISLPAAAEKASLAFCQHLWQEQL